MEVKYLTDDNGLKFVPYCRTDAVFNADKTSLENILSNLKDHVPATYIIASDLSVQKYGADFICDGEDDDAVIRTAINLLPPVGGKIILLEGTYNFRSQIVVSQRPNVVIEGTGGGSTILNFEGNGFDLQNATCIIKDVAMYGTNEESSTGIKSLSGTQCSLLNCDVFNFDCCIDIDNEYWGAPSILHNVNCGNCTIGMKLRGAVQAINCTIDGAIQISDSDMGCGITSSYIGYEGGITIDGDNNRIMGNYIYNNNSAGITINGRDNIIAGNVIFDTVGDIVCDNPTENTIGLNTHHIIETN